MARVQVEHVHDVEFDEVVAVEDPEALVGLDEAALGEHGACRAARGGFVHHGHAGPVVAAAGEIVEHLVVVMRDVDEHLVDARPSAEGPPVVEQGPAEDGRQALRQRQRERAQPLAAAARQQDGLHRCTSDTETSFTVKASGEVTSLFGHADKSEPVSRNPSRWCHDKPL